MATKKLSPKKAADRQMDQFVMAVLGLVVIGAAVIVWQAWTIKTLEASYSSAEGFANTAMQRSARQAENKATLAKENDSLKQRLERWNLNAKASSYQGDLLVDVLVKSGFPQDDTLLWNFEVLRVGQILDDAKTPYAIMTINDGTQDRGLFVAKRIGVGSSEKEVDNYEFVPGTFRMISNYAHQVMEDIRWSASKQVAFSIITFAEDGSKLVDKQVIDLP
jgi:hypothetical protein